VSTKKTVLTPAEKQVSEIIKATNTNIDDLINEVETVVKNLEEKQYQYLKNNKAKGVQQGNVIRDNTGTVTGRFGRISNNDRWYREFYAENGRPPNNAELREMAKKHLLEGFDTDAIAIPANDEYVQAVKDLEMYKNIKAKGDIPSKTTAGAEGLFVDYHPDHRAIDVLTSKDYQPITIEAGYKPDEYVTVYRGAPKHQKVINNGDWVTTTEQLAKDYAGGEKVIKEKIKAKYLYASKGEGVEELIYSNIENVPNQKPIFTQSTITKQGTQK